MGSAFAISINFFVYTNFDNLIIMFTFFLTKLCNYDLHSGYVTDFASFRSSLQTIVVLSASAVPWMVTRLLRERPGHPRMTTASRASVCMA